MRTALARFKRTSEMENQVRKDALDDLAFSTGDQWDATIRSQRELDGRPCLTINRLPQFIRQVTNEQRQQRPSGQINPVGSGADVETAEILSGIMRHIEVNSDADVAYDTGMDQMVRTGFGYWRVITYYVDPETEEQEIGIERIKNQFRVYYGPAEKPDYSDANYAFIVEDVPKLEYEQRFKKYGLAPLTDFTSVGDKAPGWVGDDYIRIAEYFYVEEVEEERQEKEPEEEPEMKVASSRDRKKKTNPLPAAADVENEQGSLTEPIKKRAVKWALISALDCIEGGPEDEIIWPGRWIPIVPVLGEDIDVDGKRYLAGLVRNAKDAQRAYNYWETASAEMIALAPKAPWIMAEGQQEGNEEKWRTSNRVNWSYLTYKPIDVAGRPVQAPQRQSAEPPIQAMALMIRQADNDLKATTGLYDASLGQQGPEQSGKAILARQKQGDTATINYSDNLGRAIRHTWRICLDLIPIIYDIARIQRIIDPDGTVRNVGIFNSRNSNIEELPHELSELKAEKKLYDIGLGRYDVTVSIGPSFQTRRQEAVQSIMALVTAYPQAMSFVGDLLVRNMDWPYAKEIADRFKKMLPPQLQEDTTDPTAKLNQLQAGLANLQQHNQQLIALLNQATSDLKSKRFELESRERIAAMQAQAGMIEALAKTNGQAALAKMNEEFKLINDRMSKLHEAMSIDAEIAANAGAGSAAVVPTGVLSSPPAEGVLPAGGGTPTQS